MSSTKRPVPPSRTPSTPPRRSAPPNRNQIFLIVTSALIVCSLVGGVFVGLGADDIFGDLFSDDGGDQENYIDPNSDLISAQETIVANSPDNVEDVLLLASLLANSGRLADSIPHYEHVLELAPDDVAARLSFARALADGGMQADAELQFERVLEMDPDNQQGHYYLAELYMASTPQRIDDAIEHYRIAAELDSTTLIGERSQTQLDTLGAGRPAESSPVATPGATPAA